MRAFVDGVGVIAALELRQRVRGTGWYVLLSVFAFLVAIVTILLTVALSGLGSTEDGGAVFSSIIYFVLLLGTLVAPALSGNAINGDRDAGTLATTQITLITTGQLMTGKFLAAWATGLAFLAAAVPFLVFSALIGGLGIDTMIVATLVLVVELGIVAAIGVGLSALLTRPLFSIVVSYLVVAALSVGTLIAFGLAGLTVQSQVTSTYSAATEFDAQGRGIDCSQESTSTYTIPRYDYFWGVLVANPYVVLADAVPTQLDARGQPQDLFGLLKVGVREAQLAPDLETEFSDCEPAEESRSSEELLAETVPGWAVGLLIQVGLAVAAMLSGTAAIRTPAARLGRGSRIA